MKFYISNDADTTESKLRHSKPGITSFIMSMIILCGCLLYIKIIFTPIAYNSDERPTFDDILNLLYIIFLTVVIFFMNVSSIVLGVIGLKSKETKKSFALLGLILSSLEFLPTFIVTVLTLALLCFRF